MFVIAACYRRYSGSTSRWHNKEYGHFKLALREGLAIIYADWYFLPWMREHSSFHWPFGQLSFTILLGLLVLKSINFTNKTPITCVRDNNKNSAKFTSLYYVVVTTGTRRRCACNATSSSFVISALTYVVESYDFQYKTKTYYFSHRCGACSCSAGRFN